MLLKPTPNEFSKSRENFQGLSYFLCPRLYIRNSFKALLSKVQDLPSGQGAWVHHLVGMQVCNWLLQTSWSLLKSRDFITPHTFLNTQHWWALIRYSCGKTNTFSSCILVLVHAVLRSNYCLMYLWVIWGAGQPFVAQWVYQVCGTLGYRWESSLLTRRSSYSSYLAFAFQSDCVVPYKITLWHWDHIMTTELHWWNIINYTINNLSVWVSTIKKTRWRGNK